MVCVGGCSGVRGGTVLTTLPRTPLAAGFDLFYNVAVNETLRGPFETTLLATLAALGHGASGLDVRRRLGERTGRLYAVGAIYTGLQRLEAKGLVTARLDEPRAMRGGRARRLFTITGAGVRALEDFRHNADRAWGLSTPDPA